MSQLTTQQQQALEVRNTSIVLSAGAGCGKTTVLTERFVTALDPDGGVPLNRIVALTFTDKAASELRNRVRMACRAKLDEGEDSEYWRGILRGLEAAPIGTFHTFCGEIVRQYAVNAGVDPGFRVLDESIASTYRELAVDAMLRRALGDRDENLRELAVEHGLDSVRETLVQLMSHRSAPSLETWAAWMPEQLKSLWEEAFETRAKPAVLRRLHRDLRLCVELLESHECRHHPKMRERRGFLLENIPNLLVSTEPVALIEAIKEHAKVQGVVAAKWPTPDLYEQFSATFKEVRDRHIKKALVSLTFDDANTLISAEHGIRFTQLASKSWQVFEEIKHQRGALDFNDLLLKARDLLRDDSISVRAELIRRFDLVLVDEFQDTDPVQDEIIRRIGGGDFASGRLFLVGDFKQSIYGFRGARPDLFAQYRQEFPEDGQRLLTENFRSRAAVLTFINALFADAFTESYEQLIPGRIDPLPDSQTTVVFAWPEPRADPDSKNDRDVDQKRHEEASRLARLIRNLIDQQFLVRDKATREVRPIHAGDVAFLFRKNSAFLHYERALDDVGLDYHLIGGPAYYAQQEIQDLIHVLTILDDPHDSLALAGALRSPFFALSDEALFWLTTVETGDLADGLNHCDEATLPDLSPRDRKHAIRAQELLTRWRSFKDREPIAALVGRVIEESGFEAALLGEPLGARKRANARKLVRIARKFDGNGGFALADFVARLRADMKSPPAEEQAGTTDETGHAVRLLTIHKAKGLEFPVVVVPDIDSKSHSQHNHMVFDEELGPIINAKADSDSGDDEDSRDESIPSLGWAVYRRLREEEDRAEDLRVFYVATTRTRDLLVLSSSESPTGKPQSAAMELLQERFDVMTGTCQATLPSTWAEPEVQVIIGAPTGGLSKARRDRRRPPVRAIARLIERSPVPPPGLPATHLISKQLPTYWNLDSSTGLSPSAARLDRLVRSIVIDPRSLKPENLEDVAADCARRQNPAASSRLTVEALGRIRHWLVGPLGREIALAKEVVRDVPWTVTKRFSENQDIVIEGRIDLAYRDSRGLWRMVQVGDATAPDDSQRLRLALSTSLASALGCGPIHQSWWISHGPGGGLRSGEVADEPTVTTLLAAFEGLGANR